MTYAGLTTADKPALLDAKARGLVTDYVWINGLRFLVNIDLALAQIAEMESKTETILGYPIEHLQKIAAIMQTTHITPEQVRECADNLTLCVTLTMNALKEHMDKSMTEHIENQQALYSPYTEGEKK